MQLSSDRIPRDVHEVCERLASAGHRSWVVGGCVRDLLLGQEVSDWDLATSAMPKEVQATFRRTIPTGLQHGTVTVMHRGEAYEITTLRGEGAYTDGRRPSSVTLGVGIEEDLARRDFTVNAIAFDPLTSELVDPFDGLADLSARLIRAVRDPVERFNEDGLRVLRAARFAATLGFELDRATRAAIPGSLATFAKVSPERVSAEWRKAFEKGERPSKALRIMRETGILEVTCAPLAQLESERFDATLARVDATERVHVRRLAGTLLDVGGDAQWLESWLEGMRTSNRERRQVMLLVRVVRSLRSQLNEQPEALLERAAVRRWMAGVGRDPLPAVFDLARASGLPIEGLESAAREEMRAGTPLATKELRVSGDDVLRELEVSPSRAVGLTLTRLLEMVHADPARASRERLLALLPEAYAAVTEPEPETPR